MLAKSGARCGKARVGVRVLSCGRLSITCTSLCFPEEQKQSTRAACVTGASDYVSLTRIRPGVRTWPAKGFNYLNVINQMIMSNRRLVKVTYSPRKQSKMTRLSLCYAVTTQSDSSVKMGARTLHSFRCCLMSSDVG